MSADVLPEIEVSGLDDLAVVFELRDDDGTPITAGTAEVLLAALGTTTAMSGAGSCVFAASYVGTIAGVSTSAWRCRIDDAALTAILPPVGARFDVLVRVPGQRWGRIARCRRVVVLDDRAPL